MISPHKCSLLKWQYLFVVVCADCGWYESQNTVGYSVPTETEVSLHVMCICVLRHRTALVIHAIFMGSSLIIALQLHTFQAYRHAHTLLYIKVLHICFTSQKLSIVILSNESN